MAIATEAAPSTRPVPTITGLQHLGLTVRDIEASEAWYSRALGLIRLFAEPHSTGDGYAVVMTRPGTALVLGLDHHPDADREMFSPLRTGLDHLALQVTSRDDLDEWCRHLDALGIAHGEVVENAGPPAYALFSFRDPDGIPIELFWFGG